MNRIVGSLLFLSDLLLRAMDPRTVAALWRVPLKDGGERQFAATPDSERRSGDLAIAAEMHGR